MRELARCGPERHCNLTTLPFPPGFLPPTFTYCDVIFLKIWDKIRYKGSSLWCTGSEEFPPGSGTFYDAKVRLDFGTYSPLHGAICKISAKVDGHGPKAKLEGFLSNGGSQIAERRDKGELIVKTKPDNPFFAAELSGQEAEWFHITLNQR